MWVEEFELEVASASVLVEKVPNCGKLRTREFEFLPN
jgi:hypothetical protein